MNRRIASAKVFIKGIQKRIAKAITAVCQYARRAYVFILPSPMPSDVAIFRSISLFSLVYFPILLVLLYVFSIKQTFESGDCPIAIDLNNNGEIDVTGHTSTQNKLYTIFSINEFILFDIQGDGMLSKIDWIEGGKDGLIVEWNYLLPKAKLTGLDLIGIDRLLPDGSHSYFENGYEKLASFDSNGDGQVSGNELNELAVWKDDGDALLEAGELVSFDNLGIVSLSTSIKRKKSYYGFESLRSMVTLGSGETLMSEDVWFLNEDDLAPFDQALLRNVIRPLTN